MIKEVTFVGLLDNKDFLDLHAACLSDRESDVIALRYCATPKWTQKAIGLNYNVCRNRIFQIEQIALRKLRGSYLRSIGHYDRLNISTKRVDNP